jgi:predicted metalloprotease with PDZ domain
MKLMTNQLDLRLRHCCIWIVLFFTIALTAFGTDQPSSLSYTISIDNPDSKVFNVQCEIRNPDSSTLQLDWPSWTPGYVVLWNYGQHVSKIKAVDQTGHSLTVRRVSDSRVYVEGNNAQTVTVNYNVHAIDPPENLGFAQAYLDSIQGWYNGAALFPEIEGMRDLSTTVRFVLPQGWDLATAMMPNEIGDGFIVRDFDELVDSPVQLGQFLRREFMSQGVRFQVVVAGCDSVDMNHLERLLKTIVTEAFTLMQNVPIDRYLFIFHAASRGAGGLEHLNATTISLRTEEYFRENSWLKVVTAHEFFHVWNAKRIRARTFDRYDYSRPHRTRTVWFAEGVTAYYTDLLLHRCDLYTKEDVYRSLAQILDAYENNPARKRLSWEDISWYIWEPELRQGLEVWLLPGWMIDLKIRDVTDNRFSLDDVMRFMDKWYGMRSRGFEEEDIPRICSAVAQRDLSDFFRRHISGCEPFPYRELFRVAGLEWYVTTDTVPSLGSRFGKMVDGRVKVVNLDEEETPGKIGLRTGDIILKINDHDRPTFDEVQRIQRDLTPDSMVTLLVDREGVQHTINITVSRKTLIRSTIQEISNPTPRQLAIRQGILKGTPR